MRPFYEQFHYHNRPLSKVGSGYARELVTDFVRWHSDNIEKSTVTRNGKIYMTAASMLDRTALRQVVRRGVGGYCNSFNDWPDFLRPKTFAAMNILHAITMAMPKVQPADKLQLKRFIPVALSNDLQAVNIVKVWPRDVEIDFSGVPAGDYFLKANHGSRFNIKVTIPCSDAEMDHIRSEAKRWVSSKYGQNSCQWWYQFIKPHIFLEKSLLPDGDTTSIKDFRFHVINGKPAILQMETGVESEERNNPVYDADLNYLPHDFLRENLREEPLPALTQKAQEIAVTLGSNFQYCRVDLYILDNTIHLGELTFLPNAGRRAVLSPELDEYLCSHWKGKMPLHVRVV